MHPLHCTSRWTIHVETIRISTLWLFLLSWSKWGSSEMYARVNYAHQFWNNYLYALCIQVKIGFLPVGHTHKDIDQQCSCISRRLKLVSHTRPLRKGEEERGVWWPYIHRLVPAPENRARLIRFETSGGSRGGSRGAQEPPFWLHLALRSILMLGKWNPPFWLQN